MNRRRTIARGATPGFSLVEMLVVVVIILILSGILLRIVNLLGDRRGKCVTDLENIQHALNEYAAHHSSYPPVNHVMYEYESAQPEHQTPSFTLWLSHHNNPSNSASFFPDCPRGSGDWAGSIHPDWGLGYRYGLFCHLWARARGNQPHWYDRDAEANVASKGKWGHYLKDIDLTTGIAVHTSTPSMAISTVWTNLTVTICDPWGHEIRYRCAPPFKRYRLWSAGPDGMDGTGDDIPAPLKLDALP